MLRRRKHALSQSATPFACTLFTDWLADFCGFHSQRLRDENKNKICTFEGGVGRGRREENSPKTLFFLGNGTTINFEFENWIVETFCCHCSGSYILYQPKGGNYNSNGHLMATSVRR